MNSKFAEFDIPSPRRVFMRNQKSRVQMHSGIARQVAFSEIIVTYLSSRIIAKVRATRKQHILTVQMHALELISQVHVGHFNLCSLYYS